MYNKKPDKKSKKKAKKRIAMSLTERRPNDDDDEDSENEEKYKNAKVPWHKISITNEDFIKHSNKNSLI